MGLRRLHNEELFDLYSSSNNIRVFKSIRKRWAGHVARTGDGRGAYIVSKGVPIKRDHLENTDLDWRIILKWIFKK